jgi:HAD superfamily hydrolase (TIGR01490 family)
MGSIAFFDVDKTVLSVNSAALWVNREFRAGNITGWQALRAGLWLGLYHLGVAGLDHVIVEAVRGLRGLKERDIIDRTMSFFASDVRTHIQPAARAAIANHKAKGDLIFLLTSSTNYLCAPLGDELQIDGFLANRLEVEQGVFTGVPVWPLCFGAGKVEHARVVADKLGIALAECAFYTDSMSDLPMLEAVGRPVVVDPDPRLRRIAAKRGWPIQRWRATPRAMTSSDVATALPPPPTTVPAPPPPPPASPAAMPDAAAPEPTPTPPRP